MEQIEPDVALKAGVASLVLAAGSATATLLANRRNETQTLGSVGSALALAAAAFGVLGIRALVRMPLAGPPSQPHRAASESLEARRAAELLQAIAGVARAGAFVDPAASEVAFALIARQANEALEALARIESRSPGVSVAL